MTNSLDTENEQTPLLDGTSASVGIVPARKRASLEGRLRVMLEADLASSDGVVIRRACKISRKHYVERLGITPDYARRRLRNIFEEYEAKLAAIGADVSPLEERLRAALEQDRLSADGIRTGRWQKINRTYYAARLGVGRHMVGQCRYVLENYEAGFPFACKAEHSIVEMRAWLTERFEAGELGIRAGKVERGEFFNAFGFKGASVFTRYPQIRALVEEFDKRVVAEGYLPKKVRDRVDLLKQILDDNCPINRDRLTVNRHAVSAAIGVSLNCLNLSPFIDYIKAKDEEILEEARHSKISPYFHTRRYRFDDLLPLWPVPFIERVGVRFKQVFSGVAEGTARQVHLALCGALTWLSQSENEHCRAVISDVFASRKPEKAHWEEALYAYRDYLSVTLSRRLGGNRINMLRLALQALESGNVVPPLSVPLQGFKNARRQLGHLKSLAEVVQPNTPYKLRNDVDGYIDFAQRQLIAAGKQFRIEFDVGESSPFAAVLADELGRREDLPSSHAEAILQILNNRLKTFHTEAAKIVDRWKSHHAEGQRLLASTDFNAAEFYDQYTRGSLNKYELGRLLRRFFPGKVTGKANQEDLAIGLPNLLVLAVQVYNGLLPGAGAERAKQEVGQWFHKRYLEYLPFLESDAYLNPHRDAFGAALTLYLIESGANISVGRTLDVSCIESSDLPGYKRITGYKARARGKPIIVDLDAASPAVRAMEWLAQGTKYLRRLAPSDEQDRLFLMRVGERCQLMTPHWYTNWFRAFASKATGREDLRFTPNMIRPSVLLKAALENDGRLTVGMAIGQHTEQVTQGYQSKWPIRVAYDNLIRRFQNAFEALVARNIEEAAAKLGLPQTEFEKRLGELAKTGLGTFCADPRGRLGNNGQVCKSLDCWNDCPHMIVVAEVEAIAALQIWRRALLLAQPEWERDRPERWEEVWLPWLCLTQVVEEGMVRGPHLLIWKKAQKRAAEIVKQEGFVPPAPY